MDVGTNHARDLADELYVYRRSTEHIFALFSLDNDHLDQWDDWSPDGIRQRLARLAEFVDRADRVLAASAAGQADRTLLEAASFLAQSEKARLAASSISCSAMPTSQGNPPPPCPGSNATVAQPAATKAR